MFETGGATWRFVIKYDGKDDLAQAKKDLADAQKAIQGTEKSLKEYGDTSKLTWKDIGTESRKFFKDYGDGFLEATKRSRQFVQELKAVYGEIKNLPKDLSGASLFGITPGIQAAASRGPNPFVQGMMGPLQAAAQAQAGLKGPSLANFEALKPNLAGLIPDVKKLTQAVEEDNTAQKKKKDTNEQLGKSFFNLNNILRSAALAWAGIKLTQFIKDAAETAARADQLAVVIQYVGARAGYTAGGIQSLENGLKQLNVTTLAARQSLAFMEQSGLDLSKALDLQKVAMDASVVAGLSLDDALQRIVVAIQRQNTWGLRSLGLFVNLRQVFADYAKETGRNVNELSAQEKQQIELNAVLEKGKLNMGAFSASLGTVGTQMQLLQKDWEEAKRVLGEGLQPILGGLVKTLDSVVKSFQDTSSALPALITGVATLTAGFLALRTAMLLLGTANPILFAIGLTIAGITALLVAFNSENERLRRVQEDRIKNIRAEASALGELQDAYHGLQFYEQEQLRNGQLSLDQKKAQQKLMEEIVTKMGPKGEALRGSMDNSGSFLAKVAGIEPDIANSAEEQVRKQRDIVNAMTLSWVEQKEKLKSLNDPEEADLARLRLRQTIDAIGEEQERLNQLQLNASQQQARLFITWQETQEEANRVSDDIAKDLEKMKSKLLGPGAEITREYEQLLQRLSKLGFTPKTAAEVHTAAKGKEDVEMEQARRDRDAALANARSGLKGEEQTARIDEINAAYAARAAAIHHGTDEAVKALLEDQQKTGETQKKTLELFAQQIEEFVTKTKELRDEARLRQQGVEGGMAHLFVGEEELDRRLKEIDASFKERDKQLRDKRAAAGQGEKETLEHFHDRLAFMDEEIEKSKQLRDVQRDRVEADRELARTENAEKMLTELDKLQKKQREMYDERLKLEGRWRDESLEGIRQLIKEQDRAEKETQKFLTNQKRILADADVKGLSQLEGVADQFVEAIKKATTPQEVVALLELLPKRLGQEVQKATKDIEELNKKMKDLYEKEAINMRQARYAVGALVARGMNVRRAMAIVQERLLEHEHPLHKQILETRKKLTDEHKRQKDLQQQIPNFEKQAKDAADAQLKALKDMGNLRDRENAAVKEKLKVEEQVLAVLDKQTQALLQQIQARGGQIPPALQAAVNAAVAGVKGGQKVKGPFDPKEKEDDVLLGVDQRGILRETFEKADALRKKREAEAKVRAALQRAIPAEKLKEFAIGQDIKNVGGGLLQSIFGGLGGGIGGLGAGFLAALTQEDLGFGGLRKNALGKALDDHKAELEDFGKNIMKSFNSAADKVLKTKTEVGKTNKELNDAEAQFKSEFENAGLFA